MSKHQIIDGILRLAAEKIRSLNLTSNTCVGDLNNDDINAAIGSLHNIEGEIDAVKNLIITAKDVHRSQR